MSYYYARNAYAYRNRFRAAPAPAMDTTTQEEVKAAFDKLANSMLDAKTAEIVASIKEQFERKQNISFKQKSLIEYYATRFDGANIAKINAWAAEYNASQEMQDTFAKAVEYYEKTPYFTKPCKNFREQDQYVPNEETFNKMTTNTYFRRYLKTLTAEKRSAGEMVALLPSYVGSRGAVNEYRGYVKKIADIRNDKSMMTLILMGDKIEGQARYYNVRNLAGLAFSVHEKFISKREIKIAD